MRLCLVPLLLAVLGTTAFADPITNAHVRFIHDETLARGPVNDVPTRPAPPPRAAPVNLHPVRHLAMRNTSSPTSVPSLATPVATARVSSNVLMRRAFYETMTATRTPNMTVLAMPQLIKSANGRCPGMGVLVRF